MSRRISWLLSKLYYKKSVQSQAENRQQIGLREIQVSLQHFHKFIEFQNKLQANRAVEQSRYLEFDQFVSGKKQEQHRVKITNQLQVLQGHQVSRQDLNVKQLSTSIDLSKCYEEPIRPRAISPLEKHFDDVWLGKVKPQRPFRVRLRGASQPRRMSQKSQ